MAGYRSERLSERIHQEISLILDRQVSDPRLANLTVTRVEVTGDLRLAQVYVSPRSGEMAEKEVRDALSRASGYFRHTLAKSMDLRYTPELRFHFDRSIEAGERFLEALNRVQAEEGASFPEEGASFPEEGASFPEEGASFPEASAPKMEDRSAKMEPDAPEKARRGGRRSKAH